jgi:hypothetical protein
VFAGHVDGPDKTDNKKHGLETLMQRGIAEGPKVTKLVCEDRNCTELIAVP